MEREDFEAGDLNFILADNNRLQIDTNAAYVALNICDRFDVFTTLGASSIFIKTKGQEVGQERIEWYFDDSFSWSVGTRITAWECDCFIVGVEGQYFHYDADLDCLALIREEGFSTAGISGKNKMTYHEWQAGLGIAYRFQIIKCPLFEFVPYTAVKWAGSTFKMNELGGETFPFKFNSMTSRLKPVDCSSPSSETFLEEIEKLVHIRHYILILQNYFTGSKNLRR